ncbi:epithelial cell adhesion molecule-like [Antedon mediterranea]|uniref:epithelial cell adhesion molecule-like n=1 Tax=Antedon mediterranea TaxID=105859 RepID=UPI003AF47680
MEYCRWNQYAHCVIDICGQCKVKFVNNNDGEDVDCNQVPSRCMFERQRGEYRKMSGVEDVAVPDCDEDGRYSAVQCDYLLNECWCVDELGIRIEGDVGTIDRKPQCQNMRVKGIDVALKFENDYSIVVNKTQLFQREFALFMNSEYGVDARNVKNIMITRGSIKVDFQLIEDESETLSVTDLVVFMEEQVNEGNFQFEFEGSQLVAYRDSITFRTLYQDQQNISTNNQSGTVGVVCAVIGVLIALIIFLLVLVYKKKQKCQHNKKTMQEQTYIENMYSTIDEKSTMNM